MSMTRYTLVFLALFGALTQVHGQGVDKGKAASLDADPHLVGRWTFDETTGKQAADSSGHGHHGLLQGTLTFDQSPAAGRFGKALKFSGGESSVQITGFKGITGTGPRTISAWVKTTETVGEVISWGHRDFGKMCILGFIRGHMGITPNGGYLYMKAGVNDDTWHQVAIVVQPANPPNLHDHVTLYRDGLAAEIDDIGLLDLWPLDTGADLDVRIGGGFKGLLADVRLYDRALSEEEISALFKAVK
jgi:hypothetical protein